MFKSNARSGKKQGFMLDLLIFTEALKGLLLRGKLVVGLPIRIKDLNSVGNFIGLEKLLFKDQFPTFHAKFILNSSE